MGCEEEGVSLSRFGYSLGLDFGLSRSWERYREILEYVNALAPEKADSITLDNVTEADWES